MFRLHSVTKRYARHGETITALDCPRLEIGPGEYVAVVGPSGSGKTTLLSLLGGMLSPTTGEVWLGGQSLYALSPNERARRRRQTIGFVFQSFHLIPYLTAQENVQAPLCLAGIAAGEQRRRAAATLEQFGLGDRLLHKPSELSVGQQQRVALARMLVNDPPVILADEPTGNLDPENRRVVLETLARSHRAGRTVVMVTHDAAAAEQASRRLVLDGGLITEARPATSAARIGDAA